MRCVWLLCESGNRWRPAVDHFAVQMLPAADDVLEIRSIASPEACLTALAQQMPAVVLWELPAAGAGPVLESISRAGARGANRPLQFVALSQESIVPSGIAGEVELNLRELGVAGVVDRPVSLANHAAMVRRYWQQNQRDDNLSAVREIWDRLPWAGDR
ncbi:hypothetical protein [Rosistilla oblonga]|uniref:hypothetical protein n=1 Tax=Rosistilla oblonga TaxID=2527990 RepID=UPI003A97E76B